MRCTGEHPHHDHVMRRTGASHLKHVPRRTHGRDGQSVVPALAA